MQTRNIQYCEPHVVFDPRLISEVFTPAIDTVVCAVNLHKSGSEMAYDLMPFNLSENEWQFINEIFSFGLFLARQRTRPEILDKHYLLHKACAENNLIVAVPLVWAGANPNVVDKEKDSSLQVALLAKNPYLVEFLLQNGADPDLANDASTTPLLNALYLEDFISIKNLIKFKANVNCIDYYRNTPLQLAIKKNLKPVVKWLLQAGADPNLAPFNEITPLMSAVQTNAIESVFDLIAAGADPNRCDVYGCTAIQHTNDFMLKQILLACGAAIPVPGLGFLAQNNREVIWQVPGDQFRVLSQKPTIGK